MRDEETIKRLRYPNTVRLHGYSRARLSSPSPRCDHSLSPATQLQDSSSIYPLSFFPPSFHPRSETTNREPPRNVLSHNPDPRTLPLSPPRTPSPPDPHRHLSPPRLHPIAHRISHPSHALRRHSAQPRNRAVGAIPQGAADVRHAAGAV